MTHPTHVPLSVLSIDPMNIRRTDIEPAPEFVANIAADGIRQPLLSRPNGTGYKVYEGGKRLRALWKLKENGADIRGVPVNDDYPVPLVVTELTDQQARDASLATNIHRDDMHPVDKFEAFVEQIAGGDTEEDIAKRHGIGKREVRQIVALGSISPKIRAAWRAGDIDADSARAYTMAGDHETQERVFKKAGRRAGAWQIRHAIVGDQNDTTKLLKFVGREAYEAAGGAVIEDLFAEQRSDHLVVSDTKILRKLADEKLAAKCEELKAAGWAWAETREEAGHNTWNWTQLPGGKNQSADNKAKSGCIVELKHDGTLEIRYAMQKPGQAKKQKVAAGGGKADKPAEASISDAMAHRLSCTLTAAAAKAVEGEPALALTIAVAAFMTYEGGVKLQNNGMGAKEADYDEEFDSAFRRIAKLPAKDQMAAFARIVGQSFDFQTYNAEHSPLNDEEGEGIATICNAIDAKRMNAALRETFNPEDYFNSVPKALIAAAVTEAVGKDHGAKVLKLKTKEAAEFAIANVPKTKWLPPQLRVAGYDGPAAKPAKAKPKKATKKKAA